MTTRPLKFYARMSPIGGVELLDELKVLDGTGFFSPTVFLPGWRPFRDDIKPKFAIGNNRIAILGKL